MPQHGRPLATDVDRAARKAHLAGASRAQTYSDRDLILALTSVASRVGRVPSAKEYATSARALNYPSLPTILNRMGGWAHALRAAGMEPLSAPRRAQAPLDRGVVLGVAARRRRGARRDPDGLAYERHAAGRPELPSSATLRNRLGRWSSIATQLAAQRELVRAMTPGPDEAPRAASGRRA